MTTNPMTDAQLVELGGEDSLVDLLSLERVDRDLYRANHVFDDHHPLYGGQVAAQALRAAGLSVDPERSPHSLHGYFLRPGDASRPVVYQVFRDRDGHRYSARRVVALQGGKVIFNMAASFTTARTPGPDAAELVMPEVSPPGRHRHYDIPRLFSYEGRHTEQAWADLDYPARFWGRCTADLGEDPLLHAAVLTYLSDISSGLVRFHDDQFASSASLDHALWFHRPVDVTRWTLLDTLPASASDGRGLYTGSVWSEEGRLVASLAQEALFRPRG